MSHPGRANIGLTLHANKETAPSSRDQGNGWGEREVSFKRTNGSLIQLKGTVSFFSRVSYSWLKWFICTVSPLFIQREPNKNPHNKYPIYFIIFGFIGFGGDDRKRARIVRLSYSFIREQLWETEEWSKWLGNQAITFWVHFKVRVEYFTWKLHEIREVLPPPWENASWWIPPNLVTQDMQESIISSCAFKTTGFEIHELVEMEIRIFSWNA